MDFHHLSPAGFSGAQTSNLKHSSPLFYGLFRMLQVLPKLQRDFGGVGDGGPSFFGRVAVFVPALNCGGAATSIKALGLSLQAARFGRCCGVGVASLILAIPSLVSEAVASVLVPLQRPASSFE